MIEFAVFAFIAIVGWIMAYVMGRRDAAHVIASRMTSSEKERFGLKDVHDLD